MERRSTVHLQRYNKSDWFFASDMAPAPSRFRARRCARRRGIQLTIKFCRLGARREINCL